MKTRIQLESHNDALCLGLILTDQLLFSQHFQKADLSLEPSVPQKLMALDNSMKILACTSRNVAKTVIMMRGRLLRDISTYLPTGAKQQEEILLTTPTEGQLEGVAPYLISDINRQPFFKSLVKRQNLGDKPEIELKTGLIIKGRLEGLSGSDKNMTGIHPIKIYGDEQAFADEINHRSRAGGAQVGCRWIYTGVPNNLKQTPFYKLDQTPAGKYWSHHNFGLFEGNPSFIGNKKAQKEKIREFGGESTLDFITQVKGAWSDSASSAFPPGSVSWIEDPNVPYYHHNFNGRQVRDAIERDKLFVLLGTPSVLAKRCCIGWDFGLTVDPTTFLVGIQTEDNGAWRTYCRYSLYQTPVADQIEVLKMIIRRIVNEKFIMLSMDNPVAGEMLSSSDNLQYFNNKFKFTRAGANVDVDIETWKVVTDETKELPEVLDKKARGKILKMGRKYFLTETIRRMMLNQINSRRLETRLELGLDPELEGDLKSCIEQKTQGGTIVYPVARSKGVSGKISPDQALDALRALVDSIVEITGQFQTTSPDALAMIASLGWVGKKADGWSPAWGR